MHNSVSGHFTSNDIPTPASHCNSCNLDKQCAQLFLVQCIAEATKTTNQQIFKSAGRCCLVVALPRIRISLTCICTGVPCCLLGPSIAHQASLFCVRLGLDTVCFCACIDTACGRCMFFGTCNMNKKEIMKGNLGAEVCRSRKVTAPVDHFQLP